MSRGYSETSDLLVRLIIWQNRKARRRVIVAITMSLYGTRIGRNAVSSGSNSSRRRGWMTEDALLVDFVSTDSGQLIDNSATLAIQQCLSDRQVVII